MLNKTKKIFYKTPTIEWILAMHIGNTKTNSSSENFK